MLPSLLRLRRPSAPDLQAVLDRQGDQDVTYAGVGGTISGQVPPGYRSEHLSAVIGHGDAHFDSARGALADWRPQRGSGFAVVTDGPIAEGTTVALAVPLPVGWVLAACRIVAVIDDADSYGFAYGTLPEHPESGEELFAVDRHPDGSVTFRISVFWKPHGFLPRVGSPVVSVLQRRGTRAYLDAMRLH